MERQSGVTGLHEACERRFRRRPAHNPAIERLLASMRDNNVALNPTLWVLGERQTDDAVNRARMPWMYAVTKRAKAIGGRSSPGLTD